MIVHRRCKLALALLSVFFPTLVFGDDVVAVGATPATFEVDQQGGAVYRIPLAVSPGSGGMQPSMALVYSNQSGDGLAGVGWSLEGLSTIHRCAAIKPVHGYQRQVAMDALDALCIDGRFLVAMDASETMLRGAELRTYIESFTKIVGDDTGFVAWMKDGRRIVYGDKANARVESDQGETFSWLMSQITDRLGNVMNLDYIEFGNERHIEHVRYGVASLSFEYEPRLNTSTRYLAGVASPLTRRLKRVVSRVGDRLVREYRLGYLGYLGYEESNSAVSDRLSSVTECAEDGSCLRPSLFHWQPTPTFGFFHWGSVVDAAHAGYVDDASAERLYRSGDFNGDGLMDVYEIHGSGEDYDAIWLNQGDGSFTSVTGPRTKVEHSRGLASFHFADFNGDGLTDIYQFRYGNAYDVVYLTGLSGEDLSFQEVDGIDSGIRSSPSVAKACVHRDCLRFGDFNGDGRVDVYHFQHRGSKALVDKVHLSNGDGTYQVVAGIESGADDNEDRAQTQVARLRVGDFNGDGISDIYHIGDSGIGDDAYIYLTVGDGEYRRINAPVLHFNSRRDRGEQLLRIKLGDFNGDGLTDIYYATPGKGATLDEIYLSRGDGSYASASAPGFAENSGKEGLKASLLRIRFGDFNGDGRTDIYHMAVGVNRDKFYLAAGDGWRRHEGGDASLSGSFAEQINTIASTYLHDFNGDGATDIYRSQEVEEEAETKPAGIHAVRKHGNLISSFVDGLGAGLRVTYSSLSSPSIHRLAPDTDFRFIRNPPPLQMVSTVERFADRSPKGQHTSYRYGEARSDPARFGFLGFAWKEARDTGRGLVTREVYSQHFPHFGSTVERKITDDEGRVISSSSVEYATSHLAGGKTLFPHMVRSVSQRYELDGSLVSGVTVALSNYDEYGNAGVVETVTESGGLSFTRMEQHDYLNDEHRWLLGLAVRTRLVESDDRHADISRIVEFDYAPKTALLVSESVSPNESLAVARSYEYDEFGNRAVQTAEAIHQATTPLVTRHTYDLHGRFPLEKINAEGHVTTYAYDERFGQPLIIVEANGVVTARRYDGWGRLSGELRSGGVRTTIVRTYSLPADAPLESVYMVVRQTSGRPQQRILHDAYGRVLSVRTVGFDGGTLFENRVYDEYGRVTRVSLPSASVQPTDWVERRYDALDRMIWESSPLVDGEFTERHFVYAGLTVEHIDELRRSKRIERDGLGRVVRVTEPTGGEMSFAYDPASRMVKATNAHGDEVTMEYDVFGNRLRLVHPDQGEQRFAYDPFGRVISAVDATGAEQQMKYDRLGRLIERGRDEGVARWSYDASRYGVGKLSKESYGGHSRVFLYDNAGRMSTIDDSRGYRMGVRHEQGRLKELHYPQGLVVQYSYNEQGYLSGVSSPFFKTGDLAVGSDPGEISADDFYRGRLEEYESYSAFYRQWALRLGAVGDKELATELDAAADELERGMVHLRREVSAGRSVPSAAYCEGKVSSVLAHAERLFEDGETLDASLRAGAFGGENLARGMYARMVLSERMLDEVDACLLTLRSVTDQRYDVEDDVYYWRALELDTVGRVVSERTGDGWRTRRHYHTGNGYLQEIKSDFGDFDDIRHLVYYYDEADNLLTRTDVARQLSEYLAYDDLDRLVASIVIDDGGHDDYSKLDSYAYDELGNLIFKSGVGDYKYGDEGALPHAVVKVDESDYAYDGSGNLIYSPRLTAGWFSFGKPSFLETIEGDRLEFEYDANGDRLLKRSSGGDLSSYFGKFYKRVLKSDGSVEHFYYIYAGDRLVAVRRDRQLGSSISRRLFYLHQDALGSVDTITDDSGSVVEQLSYTPFGERRSSNWRRANMDTYGTIDRGFSGHEYLEEVQLVHMNGRIYDPRTSRFLSPDPYVPSPLSAQSYNRYSYALNNPMKFSDPSGFFLKKIFKGIKRAVKGVAGFVKDNFRTIASVASGYYAGGWAAGSFVNSAVSKLVWSPGGMWSGAYMGAYNSALANGAILGGAVSAGVASAVSGGGLREIAANVATGGVLQKIGASAGGQWGVGRVVSSATVRGIGGELAGGRFQDAALSSLKWGGLRYAAGRMRQAMVAQSLLNPVNASGQSVGLWGDGFKLGGKRYDALSNSSVVFGGYQGGEGRVFGTAYAPGSLWDRLLEAYAGPHDYFNGFYWYDSQGNIDINLTSMQRSVGMGISAANLFVATPFAAAALLPSHNF